VGRGGPDFLAVHHPPVAVALGLQLHVGRVAAGLRLAVANGKLDLGAENLRQELALELIATVADERLTDDAHALADLRGAHARERLVEYVLVDALHFLAAVLPGPGHAQPALGGELFHERAALGRVGQLGEVLAGEIHDLGVVVVGQPLLNFLLKSLLGLGKIEIQGYLRCPAAARRIGRDGTRAGKEQ